MRDIDMRLDENITSEKVEDRGEWKSLSKEKQYLLMPVFDLYSHGKSDTPWEKTTQ